MADEDRDRGILSEHIITTPRPDPTVLTQQALLQAIGALREILEAKLAGTLGSLEARLAGMDKAIALLHEASTRLPSDVDTQVAHLQNLVDEKFRSVAQQFTERDTRSAQALQESKDQVEKALQAQRESVIAQHTASATAIAKSESATDKRIDQLVTLLNASKAESDGKIGDLKDRMNVMEGRGTGMASSWGVIVAALGILGMIGGLVVALMR